MLSFENPALKRKIFKYIMATIMLSSMATLNLKKTRLRL